MRSYRELSKALSLSSLRDPVTIFFTVALPAALVGILGTIFGNDPRPEFNGQGFIGMQLPALTGMVLAMMGVLTIPIDLVSLRDKGVLRRLRVTPLRPGAFIAADLTRHFAMGILGLVLALGIGAAVFGVTPEGSTVAITVVLVLGLVAFMAFGYVLAAILPSLGVVTPVGNILVIALMMTSGAMVPVAVMSEGLRNVIKFSPLTQFVQTIGGIWHGDTLSQHWISLVVLAAMILLCGLAAAKLFRWE